MFIVYDKKNIFEEVKELRRYLFWLWYKMVKKNHRFNPLLSDFHLLFGDDWILMD